MKGRRRVQRSYSPEEKAEALRRLALNEGNILRTAREISVPTATLYHWQGEQLQGSIVPWVRDIEKLIKNAWKNILALNNPIFVKKLKAQLLENGSKGNLKEIAQYTSVMLDKIMVLKRVQLLTGGSKDSKKKSLEELSDEELERLYQEEETKEKKKKEGG